MKAQKLIDAFLTLGASEVHLVRNDDQAVTSHGGVDADGREGYPQVLIIDGGTYEFRHDVPGFDRLVFDFD